MACGSRKWHEDAALLGEQLLRVPVRRGDDRLPGAESVSQRAGSDLRLVEIRRDVDVRRTDEFLQFLQRHEAIVKDDVACRRRAPPRGAPA